MTFPDITADLKSRMPELRGRLLANQPLAELTWFRVGGPAQMLFMPEDENDLAYFLKHLPADIPVIVIGLGSNLIVRDGGVPGVVIRLGRGFNDVTVEGSRIRAGAAVPDVKVARAAQEAGLAGLSFYRGIPSKRSYLNSLPSFGSLKLIPGIWAPYRCMRAVVGYVFTNESVNLV